MAISLKISNSRYNANMNRQASASILFRSSPMDILIQHGRVTLDRLKTHSQAPTYSRRAGKFPASALMSVYRFLNALIWGLGTHLAAHPTVDTNRSGTETGRLAKTKQNKCQPQASSMRVLDVSNLAAGREVLALG